MQADGGRTIFKKYQEVIWDGIEEDYICYELRTLGLDNRPTLVLSNTRELDRDPFTN